MGQNKPFFKKSWGHIKRLQKVTFLRTAQKFGLKLEVHMMMVITDLEQR